MVAPAVLYLSHESCTLSGEVLTAFAGHFSRVEIVQGTGYRCAFSSDGEHALRLALAENPVIVLVEVDLPVLGGYRVCDDLRREFGSDIAIAFVSATRTAPSEISSGLLVGADDFFRKPIHELELLARLVALGRRVASAPAQPW